MGKGKVAAQVAHAAISTAEKVKIRQKKWYKTWLLSGQAKVIVKADTLDTIYDIKIRAEKEGLMTSIIEDKGLTQIPLGTITCVGIGPGPTSIVKKITGKLKLL